MTARAKARPRVPLGSIAVAIVAVLIVAIPLWVVVVNSLKPYSETVPPTITLPASWEPLQNYLTVLSEPSVGRGFINTGTVIALTIPPVLLLGAAAAWIFARSRSRVLNLLYYVVLIGIVVPPALVASIFVVKALGLGFYGGLFGLSMLYVAWYIPLAIFLMTGFIRTIPSDLEDAARVDGAGSLIIFTRIILPLLTPVLITTGLIVSIGLWNDFLYPFMILNDPDRHTLMLSLFDFALGSTVGGTYSWNLVFALIVITSLPVVATYYFAQRFIVGGLSGFGN